MRLVEQAKKDKMAQKILEERRLREEQEKAHTHILEEMRVKTLSLEKSRRNMQAEAEEMAKKEEAGRKVCIYIYLCMYI